MIGSLGFKTCRWKSLAIISLIVISITNHTTFGQLRITASGNMGVIVETPSDQIIIDSLWTDFTPLTTNVPASLINDITNGNAPFDNIRYALATHDHNDHFDTLDVANFLNNNSDAEFISTQQALDSLDRTGLVNNPSQVLDGIRPQFQSGSVLVQEADYSIEVFWFEHLDADGIDLSGTENYAYLVESNGASVLHLGDIDFTNENFRNFDFNALDIDAVIIPAFTQVVTAANRDVILNNIGADNIIATHLRGNDLANNIAQVRAIYGNDVIIFDEPITDTFTINAVPEPTCLPVLIGVAAIGLFRRRR